MINIQKLTPPDHEGDIIKYWRYTDKVYISCVCITFNQKEYIRDTIDSMLSQQCEYRFEIVIHDDMSTDGTRDILLEYKEKYPSIIILVLQEENQYSLGKRITPLAIEFAKGEYVALCEGDDFWIDSLKIQKQIDLIRSNSEFNLIISKAISLDNEGVCEAFCDLGTETKYIKFSECIIGPQYCFYPTATFFFKKNIMKLLPDWFYTLAPVGDYYIQLYASYNQGCIYIPDSTTVYRKNTVGSWSVSLNQDKIIKDRVSRLLCNQLIKNELALNKEQLDCLNKRACIYRKDIAFAHLKAKRYIQFFNHTIKALFSSPYNYMNIYCDSIVKLMKRKFK